MLDDQRELLIVVDETDNIIEYRTRQVCHQDSSLIHRVVGVMVYNDKGEILLQRRSKDRQIFPGKFIGYVAGHVPKGQSYEVTAKKEIKEELGIQIPLLFVNKFVIKSDIESIMMAIFKGYHNGPFKIDKKEMDMIEFTSKEKIKEKENLFTPITHDVFRKLHII